MTGAVGFALIAGILSALSPCVLPLLPLVLGAAVSQHRFGPAALAAGLTLSFTVVGLFVATVGFAIGLDAGLFRSAAAIVLVGVGLILLVPRFQMQFALAAGPMSNWAEERFGGFSTSGLSGQFGVGLLLGVVWAPCVGPTLGAASVMAARGENLGQVALTMLAFGFGAALPLLLLGLLSRETMLRLKASLLTTSRHGKLAFGSLLILLGVLILSGLDKASEAFLVEHSPDWLTQLTTRF